jgi:hypothetical protein
VARLEVRVGKLSENKEREKRGFVGIRGILEGQGKTKREQLARVLRERQKIHARA